MQYTCEQFNAQYGTRVDYKGRFDRIPLPIDTERFCPCDRAKSRKRYRINDKQFVLLYVGKLSLAKADLAPLITAFSALSRRNPDKHLTCVLAGTDETSYFKTLSEHAQALGVAEKIRFYPDVTDEEKIALYSAADVFVSLADNPTESFGLTPLEAMACGLPQVVSDWDGYRDIVANEETGFLIPTIWGNWHDELTVTGSICGWSFDHLSLGQTVAVNLDHLITQIQILIDAPHVRAQMAQLSRRRALEQFATTVVIKQYEQLWEELVAIDVAAYNKTAPLFMPPNYHRCFSHYASAQLSDDTLLEVTRYGIAVAEARTPIPVAKDVLTLGIIHPQVLLALLREVRDAGRAMRLADLALPVSHILFALKQGLLRVT